MKTKIYKAKKIMILLLVMIITLIFKLNVNASSNVKELEEFPKELNSPIISTKTIVAPGNYSLSAGESYKYDTKTDSVVFCSTYHKTFNSYNCKLIDVNSNWNPAIRAGIAKIIQKANIPNIYPKSGGYDNPSITSDIYQRNLQVSLAINALLWEKTSNPNYKISGVDLTSNYLTPEFQGYLQNARDEYTRVNKNRDVRISIVSGKSTQYYNPETTEKPKFVYHIVNENYDNYKAYFQITNSNIQTNEAAKLKLTFSNTNSFNSNNKSKQINVKDHTKTEINQLLTQLNGSDVNINDFYLQVELIDDGSYVDSKILFSINNNGNFNCNYAWNYICNSDVNAQTLTPNIVQPYSENDKSSKYGIINVVDYPNTSLTILKKNKSNQPLAGARFRIQQQDDVEDGYLTREYTNEQGKIEINDLEPGEYCVTEILAPSGYLLDRTNHCFTITMTSTNNSNILEVTPSPLEGNKEDTAIDVEDDNGNKNINITLTNEENILKIGKVDEDGNKIGGIGLKLVKKDGTIYKEWTSVEGQFEEISNVPADTYYLYETSTKSGFIFNHNSRKIDINGKLTGEITVTFTNKKTNIMIGKLDENKYKLEGAQLNITDKDGNVIVETWTSKENEYKNLTGILNINTVYLLNEVNPPKGYAQADPIRFKLNDTGEVILLDKNDQPLEESEEQESKNTIKLVNKKNTVSISKTDITGTNEVEGAHLQIINRNTGEIIKLKEVEDGILEPDENGDEYWVSTKTPKIIRKLKMGNYTLKEIQSPPGYVLSEETIDFTIVKSGKVKVDDKYVDSKTLIMTNEHVKVYISKQDITTKEELPGAHLTVTDESGNIVEGGDWVSTNEPHLLEELVPGTYTITEITSPDGYTKNEESVTFTIDKDGKISGNTIMYNTPTPDVPSTLSTQSIVIIVLGTILVCTGVGLYFYGLKKKKEN